MFYNDPHKLTQLPLSIGLGLVLPMWLQNLPDLLASESLLTSSLQHVLFAFVHLFIIRCLVSFISVLIIMHILRGMCILSQLFLCSLKQAKIM